MDKTEKLKHIILSKYNSIREFSKAVDIPSTTLNSSLDRGIGGMAVDRMVKICDVLNIDIKTFEPLEDITPNIDTYSKEEKNHIEDLRKLNDMGKKKVITYTKDLTEMPKYQKQIWEEEGKEYLMPKAAHELEGDFTEEDYKHDEDIMMDDEFWSK
ncbi:helix-turn-helix domain-containing protein [Clostridium baratii]|uniref:helix-turn-helix domain-containing protein n=1 Tax=Clostridium baratii TaxID=1561 RepID=UPI0030D32ACA